MNSELLIALMSLAGTVVGSLSGVLAANRLTNYRIQELEKKVEKHNTVLERYLSVGGADEGGQQPHPGPGTP